MAAAPIRMNDTHQHRLLSALFAALFVFLVLLLLPMQLGGNKGYIILAGTSMEPDFHAGDLVIVRKQLTYAVGDAVQYDHPRINAVFHRIVGMEGSTYRMQGDNNDWVDSTQPGPEHIVGKLWLYIPNVGNWIINARSPQALAMASTLFSTLLVLSFVDISTFFPATPGKQKEEKAIMISSDSRPMKINKETTAKNRPLSWLSSRQITMLSYLGIFAAIALYFLVIGFSNPVTYEQIQNITYTHQGSYNYTALADQDVYDSSAIRTGEPIFLRLNDSFEVLFNYELVSEELHNVTGSYRMLATISGENGWNRSLELVGETPLDGPQAAIVGTVDLLEIQKQVNIMKNETGLQTSRFSLWVMPVINIEGDIKDAHIEDQFAQPLEFRFDELQVTLRPDAELEPSEVEGFLYPATLRGTVSLPLVNIEMDVLWMRMLGVALMVLAVGVALALVFIWRAEQSQPAAPAPVRITNPLAQQPAPIQTPAKTASPPTLGKIIPIATPAAMVEAARPEPEMGITQPSRVVEATVDAPEVSNPETVGGEIEEVAQMNLEGRRMMRLGSLAELVKLAETQRKPISMVRSDEANRYYLNSPVTDSTYWFEES